ncbi:hypothetical protein Acr_00g0063130 [Actinidia rufa]|uniref:Uncharacterized protein n=1 Tax=Actinidia rufa TaxID=165716 RepID=A0A7J0DR42_9ERIC|nr:hypothetical protein Acr_00g0063130 [Actinidia rufa]
MNQEEGNKDENEMNQEEGNKDLGTEECEEMNVEYDSLNIDDPSNWDKMDQKSNDECFMKSSANLEECLKHAGISDIDGRDLWMELKVLREILPLNINDPSNWDKMDQKSNDECFMKSSANLEECLKHAGISDIDGRDLWMELKVLREILPEEVNKPIEVLNYLSQNNAAFEGSSGSPKSRLTHCSESSSVASWSNAARKYNVDPSCIGISWNADSFHGVAVWMISSPERSALMALGSKS